MEVSQAPENGIDCILAVDQHYSCGNYLIEASSDLLCDLAVSHRTGAITDCVNVNGKTESHAHVTIACMICSNAYGKLNDSL